MTALATLRVVRPALAAFAAMGILWGTFAAVLPDLKAMLDVDEGQLGLLIFITPIAAMAAMLAAPALGASMGRVALPVSAGLMALAFALPGQASVLWLFPLAMACCGAATGLTDVLMNARVAALENARGLHLMNLSHAAYSFGYAGGAILTGSLRAQGWEPGSVMGAMAVVGVLCALCAIERDGTIGVETAEGSRSSDAWADPGDRRRDRPDRLHDRERGRELVGAAYRRNAWRQPCRRGDGAGGTGADDGGGAVGGQVIAGRVNPFALLKGGAVVSAAGALIASQAGGPVMAYVGFIIMGIGASVIAPTAFSLVGLMAQPAARARAVARATLLGYFGYFFGPPLLGLIAGSFGLRLAFVFAAMLLAAIFVLAPLMARQRA